MKKCLPFLLLIIAFGCNKNTQDHLRLRKIESTYGLYNSYEYDNQGKLAKENSYFGFCSNPVDEYTYVYQNGKLGKIQVRMRSFYSSTATMCNPASGISSEDQYEYDNQGRLSKVTGQSSYTVYFYDNRNRVEKRVLYLLSGTAHDSTIFDYDARGNIIKEISGLGVTYYTYDDKRNPFYEMKQKPAWISAFNASPNNVIKATGASAFERKFLKYSYDLPTLVEDNGVQYTYFYQ
jgi:hypothetical protein